MYGEEEVSWTDSSRPSPVRSMTTVPEATAVNEKDPAAAPATPAHPLSILSLDLRQGHGSAAATASLPALLPSLTLQTLSQLLSRRLTASLSHISSLRTRVNDHSSRILVTGDLNAGKSTFVNALLRREVMPWDQQPCTSVFTEVIDADVNGGKEELHAIRDAKKYDRDDEATFDRYSLEEIYDVQENAGDAYYIVKAYVKDNRAPLSEDATNHSLLQNDLVDISLIDGPGLNSDNKSTTALFARQPEIDVVVFVVSAENHFTLSAQEFLKEARQEKAHVFIVVNKWQGIRDKARCMRMVGEQIKELSPTTWELRKELVHFVDAAEYVDPEGKAATEERGDDPSAFDHLEQSLRAFVCLNRTKSKLAPAKHYLLNLLADLSTLASTNLTAANDELSTALLSLERIRPIHDRLAAQRDEVEDGVDRVEESVVEAVKAVAWSRLERALQYVSNGEVVPPSAEPSSADADRPFFEIPDSFEGPSELPPYPGVWGIWEWAGDVKKVLVRALEAEVRAAEDEARVETAEGVHRVVNELGNKYLPEDAASPIVEQQQSTEDATEPTTAAAVPRAFRPEVMFAKRRRGVGRLAARGLSPGLGLGAAGQGVGWSATDFEVSFLDLFDLERIAGHSSAFGLGGGKQKRVKSVEEEVVETGTIVGLGLGSLGMVGSRVIGIKGTMQSLGRIVDVLGSPSARKWAGPALGVISASSCLLLFFPLDADCPFHEQPSVSSFTSLSTSRAPSPATSAANSPSLSPPLVPPPPSPPPAPRKSSPSPSPTLTASPKKPAKSSVSPAGTFASGSARRWRRRRVRGWRLRGWSRGPKRR